MRERERENENIPLQQFTEASGKILTSTWLHKTEDQSRMVQHNPKPKSPMTSLPFFPYLVEAKE